MGTLSRQLLSCNTCHIHVHVTTGRSSLTFLDFASGQIGLDLIRKYVDKLVSFPSMQQPDLARSYFQLVLEQLGESWRRFHHLQQAFPYKMFKLVGLSEDDWLREYRHLQGVMGVCPQCVDIEFSSVLLGYISKGDSEAEARRKILQVEQFLKDCTIFCPISSDVVECLHGATQTRLHRFRGARPTDETSKEIVVLDKITSAFGKFKDWVWRHFGDPRLLSRLCAYGQRKGNQYTLWNPERRSECRKPTQMCIESLKSRLASGQLPPAPRKLSGV